MSQGTRWIWVVEVFTLACVVTACESGGLLFPRIHEMQPSRSAAAVWKALWPRSSY